MITTHASMDIEQYFIALFLSDALHQDSVTPLSVELAVYQNVELGFTSNFLYRRIIIRDVSTLEIGLVQSHPSQVAFE